MKFKLLFLISFLATVAKTSLAKETAIDVGDSTKQSNIVIRREQRNEFNSIYSKMPSSLTRWTSPDFSFIAVSSSGSGGAFKNPQLYDKSNFFELKTESILTLPEKKWRFYGKFGYRNGFSKGGEWNLSYNLSDIGSPYYFMQEQEGEWAFQTYDFKAVVAKTLPSDKISIGVGISYNGILDFRTIDSRNESYKLNLSINPSMTLKLGSNHSVSVGLLYGRNKFEPSIYNKYQHGGETERYQIFFNQGLGTWDSNPSQIIMTDNQYGGGLSWNLTTRGYITNLIYHLTKGSEEWKLNSYSNQSTTSSGYARYEYLIHNLTANFKDYLSRGTLYAEITAKYVTGDGSPYKAVANSYLENFNNIKSLSNVTISYLPLDGYLKRFGIGSALISQRQKDLNYEHTISHVSQTSSAWVDFMFGDVNKFGLLINLNGGYHSNISNLHTPKAAASNFYTTKIALPSLAYLTSDYFIVGAILGSEFNLTNEYRFEVTLSGEIHRPTRINYGISSAKYSLGDDFYNINLSFLFNF